MDFANSIMMDKKSEMFSKYNTRKYKKLIIYYSINWKNKKSIRASLLKEYVKVNKHSSSLFVIYPKFTKIIVTNKFKKFKYTKRIFNKRFIWKLIKKKFFYLLDIYLELNKSKKRLIYKTL